MMYSAVIITALALWIVLWALNINSFTALMISAVLVFAYAAVSVVLSGNKRT